MSENVPTLQSGVLWVEAEGKLLGSEADANDLIGAAWGAQVETVAVPVERLDPQFFTLASGVAGGFMGKFVNYRMRLVIVGDISAALDASNALTDFVRESNTGTQVWFVRNPEELRARM